MNPLAKLKNVYLGQPFSVETLLFELSNLGLGGGAEEVRIGWWLRPPHLVIGWIIAS